MADENFEFNQLVKLAQKDASKKRQRDEQLPDEPENPADTFNHHYPQSSADVRILARIGLQAERNASEIINQLTERYEIVCGEISNRFLVEPYSIFTTTEELAEFVQIRIEELKTISRTLKQYAPATNEIRSAIKGNISELRTPLENKAFMETSLAEKIDYYCRNFARREVLTQ